MLALARSREPVERHAEALAHHLCSAGPLAEPERVFAVDGVASWRFEEKGRYVLTVDDARVAAPQVTRALVAAGADVLSIAEAQHSLEDVYLELIDAKEASRT